MIEVFKKVAIKLKHWTSVDKYYKLIILKKKDKMKIKLKELIKGKKTYPNWTTNSIYDLEYKSIGEDKVKIYYLIKKRVPRKIERIFPAIIEGDARFYWTIGLIKGEGSNALGKSSYRRFTFTNSNPRLINAVLDELDKKRLLKKSDISDNAFHLIHFKGNENEVISYWANKLNFPKKGFKCFEDKSKTSKYGVCHVYISDVLLRRVIDLISEKILS